MRYFTTTLKAEENQSFIDTITTFFDLTLYNDVIEVDSFVDSFGYFCAHALENPSNDLIYIFWKENEEGNITEFYYLNESGFIEKVNYYTP